MIDRITSIEGYVLAIYYCSDDFYRLCIISDRGKVIDPNDVFYCSKLAYEQGRAIIRTIAC